MSVPAIGVVKLGDIGLMARFLGDLKSPSEFPLAQELAYLSFCCYLFCIVVW